MIPLSGDILVEHNVHQVVHVYMKVKLIKFILWVERNLVDALELFRQSQAPLT